MTRSSFDLIDVVRQVLGLTRVRIEQQQVTVCTEASEGGCIVIADRGQIEQMLLNLILNALDAMPHGGQLGVRLERCCGGGVACVELGVTDTGPGIASALLPRLFEPFVTGKETGVGLGLVISKRIVEEHGGTIRGCNRPEGGASFTVRLPCESGGRESLISQPASLAAQARGLDREP